MSKEMLPGRREFVFGCIFLVCTGIIKFLMSFDSGMPSIIADVFARYSLVLLLVAITLIYARKSIVSKQSIVKWSVTIFIFDCIDLIITEFHALSNTLYPISSSDIFQSILLIPYYAFVSAAIAGFILFILYYKRFSK